jgi:hypothetical protein
MLSHAVALASGKLTHDRTGGQPTHRKSLCLGGVPYTVSRHWASLRESAEFPTSVKEVGSSSLLVMQGAELAEALGSWSGIEG